METFFWSFYSLSKLKTRAQRNFLNKFLSLFEPAERHCVGTVRTQEVRERKTERFLIGVTEEVISPSSLHLDRNKNRKWNHLQNGES